MTTLNISLPDGLKRHVDEAAAQGGFSSPAEYVEALVREDHRQKAKAALEAELLKGLDSGPSTEMTRQDWDDIRREVRERSARRAGQ
jgi:antitoxin ParD1/3/4